MRRITLWLTATITVVALVISYQANASATGGKGGDEHRGVPGVNGEHPAR
jgi:hypothetical protein